LKIIKVFGEAFSKKLQKTPLFCKKAAPKNFSDFLSMICFQEIFKKMTLFLKLFGESFTKKNL